MEFPIFNCTLRFRNGISEVRIHSVPLMGVTKQEIKYLAFLHGHESVVDVKFVGRMAVMLDRGKDGTDPTFCESDMDDLKRIANRYEKIVDPGRGKASVEKCFGVRLDGFDGIVEEVNAVEAAGLLAEEAEAAAAVKDGGAASAFATKDNPPPPVQKEVGASVFGRAL